MTVLPHNSFPVPQVKRPVAAIFWNGLVLAVLAALIVWGATYWLNFFRGPIRVDENYLLAAARKRSDGLIAYVQLDAPKLIPTGHAEEASRNDLVYESTPYFFLEVGDKLLLVKTHPERDNGKLLGPLQSMSASVDVAVRDALIAKDPSLQQKLLPITINGAAAFTVAGYLGLAFFVPAVALCAFNLFRAIASWGHPITAS